MSRLEGRLLHGVGRAIHDFRLIEEGDRVMVAVSGGKDSLAMLHLLRRLQERAPVRFELLAVNLDQCQPGFPAETLREHFEKTGADYRMLKEDTYSIVKTLTEPGKTTCWACSRLRRGILYNAAVDLGCNTIALGHHRDDLIETLLMSAFFSGVLKSMPPKLKSDDGRNTVIRPLAYCAEADIAAFAEERKFPVIPCSLCSTQENHQRKRMKALIQELAREHPAVPSNLLKALMHVVPSHLLDRSLLPQPGPQSPEPGYTDRPWDGEVPEGLPVPRQERDD